MDFRERIRLGKDKKNFIHVIGNVGEVIFKDNKGRNLVEVDTKREGNRNYKVLVYMLDSQYKYVKGSRVYIDGVLKGDYDFCDSDKKFVYIIPSIIAEVDKDFKIGKNKDFYLDYTAYNRAVLSGVVCKDPIIKEVGKSKIYRYKIALYNGVVVKCDSWGNIKGLNHVKEGNFIKVVGVFSVDDMLEVKGLIKSYKVLVQRVELD